MVRVRLLNDGGHSGFDNVEFPIVVNAEVDGIDVFVDVIDAMSSGYVVEKSNVRFLCFVLGSDCEIVDCELTPSTQQTTDIYVNCAGIEVVQYFRPLDTTGQPVFEKLHAAGSILAHQDWMRMKCGTVLATITAFGAVKAFEASCK